MYTTNSLNTEMNAEAAAALAIIVNDTATHDKTVATAAAAAARAAEAGWEEFCPSRDGTDAIRKQADPLLRACRCHATTSGAPQLGECARHYFINLLTGASQKARPPALGGPADQGWDAGAGVQLSYQQRTPPATLTEIQLRPPRGVGDAEVGVLAAAIEGGHCSRGLAVLDLETPCYDYEFIYYDEGPLSHITDVGAGRLADALATGRCSNLRELHLSGFLAHEIGPAGIARLVAALTSSSGGISLGLLDLSYSRIGAEGISTLASALAAGWGLEELHLSSSRIDDAGATCLAGALASSGLKRLNLSGNNIGADGTAALATALQSGGCSLKELEMRGAGRAANARIGDAGAYSLAAALASEGCMLTKLVLDDHGIGDKGLVRLVTAGSRLEHLSLARTCTTGTGEAQWIGDRGAGWLAAALKKGAGSRLTRLNLEGHRIGKYRRPFNSLEIPALNHNQVMDGDIQDSGAQQLADALQTLAGRGKFNGLTRLIRRVQGPPGQQYTVDDDEPGLLSIVPEYSETCEDPETFTMEAYWVAVQQTLTQLQRPIDRARDQAHSRRTTAARQRLAFARVLSVYSTTSPLLARPSLQISIAIRGLVEGSVADGSLLGLALQHLPALAPAALSSQRHLAAAASRDCRLQDESAFRARFDALPAVMPVSTRSPLPQPTPRRSKHEWVARRARSLARQAEKQADAKAAADKLVTQKMASATGVADWVAEKNDDMLRKDCVPLCHDMLQRDVTELELVADPAIILASSGANPVPVADEEVAGAGAPPAAEEETMGLPEEVRLVTQFRPLFAPAPVPGSRNMMVDEQVRAATSTTRDHLEHDDFGARLERVLGISIEDWLRQPLMEVEATGAAWQTELSVARLAKAEAEAAEHNSGSSWCASDPPQLAPAPPRAHVSSMGDFRNLEPRSAG